MYVKSMFFYDIVKVSCFNCYSLLCKRHFYSPVPTAGYITDLLEYVFFNYIVPVLFVLDLLSLYHKHYKCLIGYSFMIEKCKGIFI